MIQNFIGAPTECSTISIPILRACHFFVCRVNLDDCRIEICDTMVCKDDPSKNNQDLAMALVRCYFNNWLQGCKRDVLINTWYIIKCITRIFRAGGVT